MIGISIILLGFVLMNCATSGTAPASKPAAQTPVVAETKKPADPAPAAKPVAQAPAAKPADPAPASKSVAQTPASPETKKPADKAPAYYPFAGLSTQLSANDDKYDPARLPDWILGSWATRSGIDTLKASREIITVVWSMEAPLNFGKYSTFRMKIEPKKVTIYQIAAEWDVYEYEYVSDTQLMFSFKYAKPRDKMSELVNQAYKPALMTKK
jgi:hypothetical protein